MKEFIFCFTYTGLISRGLKDMMGKPLL